ncbi:hypothetical protein [Sphingobium agri]|uniref:Uncharacterized protein n=1 Tax=Sphingobium agri TaxID=2933566 RepID=A0ABT0DXC9_9SPHN|nr:hypothetical protein [Sphingobium agri]MCK0531774.1 hypothetical protein [Sphingobium agri]
MSFDITKRRVSDTAKIELTDGDGAPLLDDEGNRLSVTLCGPGSRTWQQADAERSRKQALRAEKNPRKIASSIIDNRRDDEIDFLVAITVTFNGWEYPHPEVGGTFASPRDMFKAAYADNSIGYIRDQLTAAGNDWAPFSGTASTN